LQDPTSDFYAVCAGVTADPDNGVCSWQIANSTCNWPRPGTGNTNVINDPSFAGWQTNIDDLWHAAVNGRGTYFSAQNPEEVAKGITEALMSVTVKKGSLSVPSFTNLNLARGDSYAFRAWFTTESWNGELQMFEVERDTGKAKTPALWSAAAKLNARNCETAGVAGGIACPTRKIYTFKSSAADKLVSFDWNSLSAAGEGGWFDIGGDRVKHMSQLCTSGGTYCLTAEGRTSFSERLVNFLRGEKGYEGAPSETGKPFRSRIDGGEHQKLGDIVTSSPAYVQKPGYSYSAKGYSEYREAKANRRAMVYVGANDGMLHAFDASVSPATGGEEVWAYVPKFLLGSLYQLADKAYAGSHRFFVDGTPVAGDVCFGDGCKRSSGGSADWHTILVGGANKGGRGYYALDITDPDHPKALWEFTHADLGYSYGNPVIVKLPGVEEKWVVLLSSGYNNDLAGGDGKGHLFVLDAQTGNLLANISTSVGGSGAPSGLAKISGYASNYLYNNTVTHVYGGDLEGNLWRFDLSDFSKSAHLLAKLKDGNGKAQPITIAPEIGVVQQNGRSYRVIFVGTGKLLSATDLDPTDDYQSFYGIRDDLSDSASPVEPQNDTSFVKQTLQSAVCPAGATYCTPGRPIVTLDCQEKQGDPDAVCPKVEVDWANSRGWYLDFPAKGERDNTDIHLVQGTLVVTTNRPQSGACVAGGVSYRYYLDYASGGPVDNSSDLVGGQLGEGMNVDGPVLGLDNGELGGTFGPDAADPHGVDKVPVGSLDKKWRRISWRELITE
jgi:type IV pilus assembly protein PilY1